MTGKHLTQQEDISHIKKSKNESISLGFLECFEICLHHLNLCLGVIEVTPSWANHHKHRDLHPRLDHCQQTWAGRKKRHMTCALKCCKPGQVGQDTHDMYTEELQTWPRRKKDMHNMCTEVLQTWPGRTHMTCALKRCKPGQGGKKTHDMCTEVLLTWPGRKKDKNDMCTEV